MTTVVGRESYCLTQLFFRCWNSDLHYWHLHGNVLQHVSSYWHFIIFWRIGITNFFYCRIIGWAVYYFIASFSYELPWEKCGNPWNTISCLAVDVPSNFTNTTSPAREYFEWDYCRFKMFNELPYINDFCFNRRNVLEQYKSNGLEYMGPVKPTLAICVFGVFVLVYFSLWKGVKSTGKAVWVTALAPYVVLIALLFRGVTLPGASEGIRYYLTPEWEKLKNTKVWIDAASQIFFSLGPGFGTLLALSSYNKFNNNCYRDALLTSSINCLTSFLAGFVIFSVLGYMAHIQNVGIDEVGLEVWRRFFNVWHSFHYFETSYKQGPGLVFIVYPEAISLMSGSTFWSIIFFLMLITLGLDSTFGGLEAMITALCDEFPNFIGKRREVFVLILLAFIYICALPTMTYVSILITIKWDWRQSFLVN